tara:strand:+ start:16502 stop:17620 length:1119 start_codon:yes stop_codon:yes gene_type:complete
MYFTEILYQFPWVVLPIQTLLGVVVSIYIHPGLIYLSHIKKLNVLPGGRSAHTVGTSVLGGVGIFFVFLITTICTFLANGSIASPLIFIALIMALFVMFFIGLKDDIMGISPSKKVVSQLIVVVIYLLVSNNLIDNFGTLFGVDTLPGWVAWPFTLFVYVLGVNAYNLIDGVDGLAGAVGTLAILYFGISFVRMEDYEWAFMSFGALGGILGFLRFNLSSKRRIFMGDNGSMFLGFLLVSMSLHYLYSPLGKDGGLLGHDIISVVALFGYPLVDVARVFLIRVKNGNSPFQADKNHLHHFLLELGLSHRQITMVVVGYTIIMVLLANSMATINVNISLAVILLLGVIIALLPSVVHRNANRILIRLPWVHGR